MLVALVGCSTQSLTPPPSSAVISQDIQSQQGEGLVDGLLFSSYPETSIFPSDWVPIVLPNKRPTEYRLVRQEQRTVLRARAMKSASGVRKKLVVNSGKKPWLHWSWKVKNLVKQADNRQRSKEDSPVRLVLAFAGDKTTLPFRDQVFSQQSKWMTGEELPYAMLVYIWENQQPVGTVIDNTHTSRIKMVVASSGTTGVGQWQQLTRNFSEDYRRAFGEPPGDLISIGVLTDTDNTASEAEAYYGDVRVDSVSSLP